jgi:hypothetical protein
MARVKFGESILIELGGGVNLAFSNWKSTVDIL